MPNPELEFFRPDDVPWTPVAGSATAGAGGPGIEEKVLNETRYRRLSRPAGG